MFNTKSSQGATEASPQVPWRAVTPLMRAIQPHPLPSDTKLDTLALVVLDSSGTPLAQTDLSSPGQEPTRWTAWQIHEAAPRS